MSRLKKLGLVLALTLGLLVPLASPAVSLAAAPAAAEELPLWELGLGIGGFTLPDYRGSDQARGYVLPVPYV
ncbi:MAG: hypothetical protein ACRD2T_14170, partial [Thermoanaerobaculia bacterium]